MEQDYSGRRQAVSHLDTLARASAFLFLVIVAGFITLLVGNLLFYLFIKEQTQRGYVKKLMKGAPSDVSSNTGDEISVVDLPPLPSKSWRWRLPEEHQGDPYEDFLQAQLDFRAYQREYVTTKLLGRFPEGHSLSAPKYLMYAATRPDRPTDMQQELLLNGRDLRDAASLLILQAKESEQRHDALAPTLSEGEDDQELAVTREALMVEAERMLRAYYSCGLYLASRDYRLHLKLIGTEMMVEGCDLLIEFYEHRKLISINEEETNSYTEKVKELKALHQELEQILAQGRQWEKWIDDDRHLEIWIYALEGARSPAVQLEAASHLNEAARRWWRYGESARAMRAIRQRASHHYSYPMRNALLNLLLAIESNEPASRIFRDHPSTVKNSSWIARLDKLI